MYLTLLGTWYIIGTMHFDESWKSRLTSPCMTSTDRFGTRHAPLDWTSLTCLDAEIMSPNIHFHYYSQNKRYFKSFTRLNASQKRLFK